MKIISAIIFIVVSNFGVSQASYAADPVFEDSLLWEVSGNGLKEKSYVAGTIHIMCEKDFAVFPKVEEAIKNSDQLYLELNFSDPLEISNMQAMAMSENLLTETLNKEQQNMVSEVLKNNLGITLEQVNQYSLHAVMSLMTVATMECKDKKMLDMELATLAASNDKVVKGLETVDAQMGFFKKAFSDEDILKQLSQVEAYKTSLNDMITAFNLQDLNQLKALGLDDRFFTPEMEQYLLIERNKNWMEIMTTVMRENSTVFAVGSMHLAQDYGLIEMLRAKGYSVTPVME